MLKNKHFGGRHVLRPRDWGGVGVDPGFLTSNRLRKESKDRSRDVRLPSARNDKQHTRNNTDLTSQTTKHNDARRLPTFAGTKVIPCMPELIEFKLKARCKVDAFDFIWEHREGICESLQSLSAQLSAARAIECNKCDILAIACFDIFHQGCNLA
eukprot:2047136-Amphidinium_carterae.1